MIQGRSSGIVLVVLLGPVILAQWSTNNAADLIPAALTFVNAGAPRLPYKWAVALTGVVGTLAFPRLILNNLFTFLGHYGALLSAIGGIMIRDSYVIRRRRINVPDLYRPHGQFFFANGFNPAGLIAWMVAGAVAVWQLQYAYLAGFPLDFLIYVVLMKTWILRKHPQAELTATDDADYLATGVSREWAYDGAGGLRQASAGSAVDVDREDA